MQLFLSINVSVGSVGTCRQEERSKACTSAEKKRQHHSKAREKAHLKLIKYKRGDILKPIKTMIMASWMI
jgi:hypothetical protein